VKIDAAANESEQVEGWKKKFAAQIKQAYEEGKKEARVQAAETPVATAAAAQHTSADEAAAESKATQKHEDKSKESKSVAAATAASASAAAPAAAGSSAAAAPSTPLTASEMRARWAPPASVPLAAADSFPSWVSAARASNTAPTLSPALILYATATGCARGIAEQVHAQWRAEMPDAPVECMSTEQIMQQPENVRATKQHSACRHPRPHAAHCAAPRPPVAPPLSLVSDCSCAFVSVCACALCSCPFFPSSVFCCA
jgi:hypothetical protein